MTNEYVVWDKVKPAKQGDLMLISINELPEGLKSENAVDGKFVLAHSESGHHHAVDSDPEIEFYTDPKDDLKSYLVVKKIIGTILKHLRSFDTHKTIQIPAGIYELRRQREYIPQGWRKAQD